MNIVYSAIVLPIAVALSPFLFGHAIFFHIDFITQHLPYFYFFKQALLSGNSFLWNPDVFSGFSGFASYNHVFLTPWSIILSYFFSPWTAYIWSVFFMLALAGVVMAMFMMRMGISRWGAFLGATTFVFSQWALIYDLPIVNTFYILPLLFLILFMFFEHHKLWPLLVGSLAVGLGLASGHWQFMIEIFVATGIFALYLAKKDKTFWRIPLAYVGMIVSGVIVSLPKLIPAIVYLQNSVRQSGVGHWDAVRAGFTIFDPLRFFVPFDIALLGFAPEHFTYVGVMVPFLFVMEFSLRRGGYVKFFSWFLLGSALLSVKYSPLYWALHHAPIFDLTRHGERWGFLAFFAVSILVGFGFDAFKNNFETIKNNTKVKIVMQLYGYAALITGMVGIFVTYMLRWNLDKTLRGMYALFDRYGYQRTSGHLSLDYYHIYIHKNVLDIFSNFDLTNFRFFFSLLFLVGAYFLLRTLRLGKRTDPLWIVLFVAINITLVFPFMGRTATLEALMKTPQTAAILKNKEQGKVFDFLTRKGGFDHIEFQWQDTYDTMFYDTLFQYYTAAAYPNTGLFYGLSSADLYDTVMARPMANLLSYVGSERSESRQEKLSDAPISLEEKIALFASRRSLLEFLGATHVTTPYEISDLSFKKVFAIPMSTQGGTLFLYQVPNTRPLYYFTNEEWLLGLKTEASPAVLQKALESHEARINTDGILLQEQRNALLRFETESLKNELLVISQNNLPGWRASMDAVEIPLYTFGTVFQALRVPQGKHIVQLEYSYWEIWRHFFKQNLGITL